MDKIEIYLDEETQDRLKILSGQSGFSFEDIIETIVGNGVAALFNEARAGLIPGVSVPADAAAIH